VTGHPQANKERETRISHCEINFPENYGVGHNPVLISILPKAGTRTVGKLSTRRNLTFTAHAEAW
jgi:hypothetical protein